MDEILLGKSKRRGSTNETNLLQVQLKNTFKPAISRDIKTTVDLYSVYLEEYSNCEKFRLTLTVKPYCTNVLFNVCTEIVKDEGSPDCYPVSDGEFAPSVSGTSVYGKTSKLYRNYMVANTEYSSPDIGYDYYAGYDMFDNHLLRSISFRSIMKVESSDLTEQTRNVFNTVRDYMRKDDGTTIKFYPRYSFEDFESSLELKMHVYNHENLLNFMDETSSIANLRVENGWYGFTNSSSINCEHGEDEEASFPIANKHNFSHVINSIDNCGFVEMFPGKERYSFVPVYNKFKNRYEKNWEIFLTYPWKCYYNHNLVRNMKSFNSSTFEDGDKNTFALATMRIQWTKVATNKNTILFRTFCRHGVSENDRIAVYLSKDNGKSYVRLGRTYKVDYVGDINGENKDYFFGVSTKLLLNDIFEGSIEELFYVQDPYGDASFSVSHNLTDVPTFASDEVLCVYDYSSDLTPSSSYPDEATYDDMPKTINQLSIPRIRVWNKEYEYFIWDYEEHEYVLAEVNTSIEYGAWNTFNDEPAAYQKDYIRVKVYDYFKLVSKKYKMRNDKTSSEVINDVFNQEIMGKGTWSIRFVKVVDDVDCKYYIREFRKIPNFKNSREQIPYGVSSKPDIYENFISQNARQEDGRLVDFDSETYKLAFSKTLYGDDVAQVTFLDDIQVSGLTDNLGRPVTEIYSTIVKKNSGYKLWYENMGSKYTSKDLDTSGVEVSRCFGSVTTGIEYLDLDTEFDRSRSTREIKGMMSSVASIYRDDRENGTVPMSIEDWDETREEKEIFESDEVFFGDVVEYCPSQCKENVLSNACFRFNTAQREIGNDGVNGDFDFTHTDLLYDDFDPIEDRQNGFEAVTYKQWLQNDGNETLDENRISVRRKEGYFYNPHTKIQLFKFTENLLQGSHRSLRIKDCRPMQSEGILIKIVSSTMHGVNESNFVYLCNGDYWYETSVTYVIDDFTFAISPMSKDDADRNGVPYMDWVSICEKIKTGDIKIRVKNEKVPSYASRIGENLFLWRNVVNPVNLPESDKCKHVFSNGAYYVDTLTSVYLRRQDPFGINGLFKGEIGEIEGNLHMESNNKYKQAKDIVCY